MEKYHSLRFLLVRVLYLSYKDHQGAEERKCHTEPNCIEPRTFAFEEVNQQTK